MGVIEDLAGKLRGAQRAVKKAQREYDDAAVNAGEARDELRQCEARVDELQRALSLLRNGLKAPVPEVGSGNVMRLKPL